MTTPFDRAAYERLIDRTEADGVDMTEARAFLDAAGSASYPARVWAESHNPDDWIPCCQGSAIYGPEKCTCWTPVFAQEQAPPRFPASADELRARVKMCTDCAYRPDSPERADEYEAELLYALPIEGKPFFCHAGMRRPVAWTHPAGFAVEGSADDYQPAFVNGMPFKADGSPGDLCAGWASIAAARRKVPTNSDARPSEIAL